MYYSYIYTSYISYIIIDLVRLKRETPLLAVLWHLRMLRN